MPIEVTLPLIAPSGLEATLQEGGSLSAATTYYYVVMAFDAYDQTPTASSAGYLAYHSPISEEGSFTTSGTQLSAHITWANVDGATNYNLLISTSSGDYTDSAMYGAGTENVGTITDGPTGYTVTDVGDATYAHHSCQVVNNLTNNISKDLGILKVLLTGDNGSPPTYDFKDLYDAIVASGYQDYVFYDGTHFTLKGTIEIDGTEAGALEDIRKHITLIRGCISVRNPYFPFTLGAWISDEAGAQYAWGCVLDVQNCRYPVYGVSETLQLYGCLYLSMVPNSETENSNTGYYHTGYGQYLFGYIEEIKDSIIGQAGRSMAAVDISDLKWNEGNNWSGGSKIRCLITGNTSCHAWNYYTTGNFYDCTFTNSSYFTQGYYGYASQYHVTFYDTTFTSYEDNLVPLSGGLRWNDNGGGTYEFGAQGEFFFWFYNSLKVKAIDENGVGLSGVEVSAIDGNGNAAEWIEHDGTFNKKTTGSTYTTNRYTNSDGEIDYYLLSYKMNHDPEDSSGPPSYVSQRISYYPYTITFSKLGYISNSFRLNMWRAEDTVITLKSSYLSNKIFDRKITRLRTT